MAIGDIPKYNNCCGDNCTCGKNKNDLWRDVIWDESGFPLGAVGPLYDGSMSGSSVSTNGGTEDFYKFAQYQMEENKEQTPVLQEKKPNEHGGFYFSSSVKITDPNTKEVLVHTRGDN